MAEDVYCCYICKYKSSESGNILNRELSTHDAKAQFSLKKCVFDEESGKFGFKSVHFGISLGEICAKRNQGLVPVIRNQKVFFKRSSESTEQKTTRNVQTETTFSEIYNLIPMVIEKLETAGRLKDFIRILKAVSDGTLLINISFHLLLDIGQFLDNNSVSAMRYSNQSLQFWSTVRNLFRGKGVNFFRGYKAQGQGTNVKPEKCKIHFIVPSDQVLGKESAKFSSDAKEPGILTSLLHGFSKEHKGKDVKISIDGKKLASGLGTLGDENLCGHEVKPSLQERQARHSLELVSINEVRNAIHVQSLDGLEVTKDLQNSSHIKDVLLVIITNLSMRVKELSELVLKTNLALNTLLKQVDADWKTSKVAPAISFCKSKIVHSNTTIRELLQSIDNLGYVVAHINGTEKDYILGSKTRVYLGEQGNYTCIRESKTSRDQNLTKQRTRGWFELRENSRITGSTMFKALGLGLLREHQEHFDKVYHGKEKVVSPSLQELFDYGTTNEINALATLVGKIIPVYYPHLQFVEDGCEVLSIGDSTAVISGDGSGVNCDKQVEVAFEFKCPMPGKTRQTDVHYAIPHDYTTPLLSQMAVKTCENFGYISYTPESATFITGTHDTSLWTKLLQTATDMYGDSRVSRPVHSPPRRSELRDQLQKYALQCSFTAEFPSLICVPCTCTPCNEADNDLQVYGQHTISHTIENKTEHQSLESVASIIDGSSSALKEAYEILRKPAKEILVTLLSDIDRAITSNDITCHAVPIHYAMAGYSLPMTSVRGILRDLLKEITNNDLNLRVIAFDGQFLEVAIAEDSGRPLTICKFMKQFWNEVQKIDKRKKLDEDTVNALQRVKTNIHPSDIGDDEDSQKVEEVEGVGTNQIQESDFETLLFALIASNDQYIWSNSSTLSVVSSPKALKVQCVKAVRRWSIQAVNVAYAQSHFQTALSKWEEENEFKGEWTIRTESGQIYTIAKWYAQPAQMDGLLFEPIIDPHHIFVNNRVRCCSKGMDQMKVSCTAWWEVAEHSKANGTGLSIELAKVSE